MDLLYKIDDLGFDAKDQEDLKRQLINYFTVDGISAHVELQGEYVYVHVDEKMIEAAQKEFEEITSLCEKGRFAEASIKNDSFLKAHPRHSEAYRVKAQMLMDQGDYEQAIDVNIDALRCDPRNVWALLLMGNLYCKYKNDIVTAEKYYDKILEYHPDHGIAINNIAAIMMEHDEFEKAIPLFKGVLEKNPSYANAYYGLALCYYRLKDMQNCFNTALEGSLKSESRRENPGTVEELHKILVSSAHAIVDNYNYENVFIGIKETIEDKYHTEIRVEVDNDLMVSASLQYGPSHQRRYHVTLLSR